MKFVGSGVNASSWFVSIGDSRIPHRPQGATWPFASLTIVDESVHFRIGLLSIRKSVQPSDAVVTLGRSGYVYFKRGDTLDDFGFCTFKLNTLLQELRERGYELDDSCSRNVPTAKLCMAGWMTLIGAAFASIVVMGVLHLHGD